MPESIFDIMCKQPEEEKEAEENWTIIKGILEGVYIGAFVQGYKHGKAKKRIRGGKIDGKETL